MRQGEPSARTAHRHDDRADEQDAGREPRPEGRAGDAHEGAADHGLPPVHRDGDREPARRAGRADTRRGEPVVVPGNRAAVAHPDPAAAIGGDETVGGRRRRAGIDPHAGRVDPEQRLPQEASDEEIDAGVDAGLERAVAVEHPDVEPGDRTGRRIEPEVVVERDRRRAAVRERLRGQEQHGREHDGHDELDSGRAACGGSAQGET